MHTVCLYGSTSYFLFPVTRDGVFIGVFVYAQLCDSLQSLVSAVVDVDDDDDGDNNAVDSGDVAAVTLMGSACSCTFSGVLLGEDDSSGFGILSRLSMTDSSTFYTNVCTL